MTRSERKTRPRSYWIADAAQVEALSNPARHEIVDRLSAMGPTSVRDLALSLGRKITTIYHHLEHLERVGLIYQVGVKAAERGRPSARYRAVAPRVRLLRAAIDPSLHKPISKWARMVGAEAARQWTAGTKTPQARISGPKRNLWFFRIVSAPSPARLARINELLDELAELAWTPDPEPGPLLSIGWFVSPIGRSAAATGTKSVQKKRRSQYRKRIPS